MMDRIKKYIFTAAAIIIVAAVLFLGVKYFLKHDETVQYDISKQSAEIIEQENIAATEDAKKEHIDELKILAFGDLMLDRNVFLLTKQAQTYEHPFLKLDSFLKEADIRLANLEGPITNFKSVANGLR